METIEIILLVVGVIFLVISFLLPEKNQETSNETREQANDEIKNLVSKEMEHIKDHVDDVVEEAVGYAVEKTERSLERLTNEKIMAVNEYSDTVLQEIHKNHEEVMFLYDMLNDKHANLKNTVSEANKTAKEMEASTKEAEAVVNSFQQLNSENFQHMTVEEFQQLNSEGYKAEEAVSLSMPEETFNAESKTQNGMDISFIGENQDTGMNKNEEILELYKQGKSNVAIAKKLGLGVGEVKLVIDLYKNL